MKNTEKKSKKFQLETFEVAKIKNMKSLMGGNDENDSIQQTTSTRDCANRPKTSIISAIPTR
jgi:hypothetical protein